MNCFFCHQQVALQKTHIIFGVSNVFWECPTCDKWVALDVMIDCYDMFDLTKDEVDLLQETRSNFRNKAMLINKLKFQEERGDNAGY